MRALCSVEIVLSLSLSVTMVDVYLTRGSVTDSLIAVTRKMKVTDSVEIIQPLLPPNQQPELQQEQHQDLLHLQVVVQVTSDA